MRRFKSIATALCLGIFALATPAMAQERTAGSTVETQMTWSALSTQINAVKAKTELVNSRVDQAVVCGKQGLLYAPDAPGNVGGCLQPKTDPSVSSNITNIINCNKAGQIYDGTKCVASTANGDDRWVLNTTYSNSGYTNSKSSSAAEAWYKKNFGKPWAIPLCSSISGFANTRRCNTTGQTCYTESYGFAPQYSNCTSCNGSITGGTASGSFSQYKCD